MKNIIGLSLLALIFAFIGKPYFYFTPEPAPGILIAEDPYQEDISGKPPWKKDDYVFKALAEFELEARVLSSSRYRFDASAELSPIDLALGWGLMSDTELLNKLIISQSGRFYYWRAKSTLPVPVTEVVQHSANMHLIPANTEVDSIIKKMRKNDLIWIKGYLVEINRADGFRWKSSLTRKDSGAGACEVIWVEDAAWIEVES